MIDAMYAGQLPLRVDLSQMPWSKQVSAVVDFPLGQGSGRAWRPIVLVLSKNVKLFLAENVGFVEYV